MSTMREISVKCAVCKKSSEQTVMTSTNQFGSPDLDLRPAPMARSTMYLWVEKCPHCGFVASSLDSAKPVPLAWLESESYKSCDGNRFASSLATLFYQQYSLASQMGETEEAYRAALRAAWACDDRREKGKAVLCRRLALARLDELLTKKSKDENLWVIRADILRRTGAFEQLIEEYGDKRFSKEILNQIIAFQLRKAREKDTVCYTVSDAATDE